MFREKPKAINFGHKVFEELMDSIQSNIYTKAKLKFVDSQKCLPTNTESPSGIELVKYKSCIFRQNLNKIFNRPLPDINVLKY